MLIIALNVWAIINGNEKIKSSHGFQIHEYIQSTTGRKIVKKFLKNSIWDKESTPKSELMTIQIPQKTTPICKGVVPMQK